MKSFGTFPSGSSFGLWSVMDSCTDASRGVSESIVMLMVGGWSYTIITVETPPDRHTPANL
jgi:hypothetical protein